MKYHQLLAVFLCLAFFISCSKDNGPGTVQYSYNSTQEIGSQINLTQTLGLDPFYITLRQVDEVVSFYSFSAGSFSILQQNTLNGQSTAYPDFYTVTEERSITWGTNSEDLLFLGNYSPKGSRDFGIRTLDPDDGSFSDLPIEFNIQQAYDPLYYRQRILMTYKDEAGAYKIAVFNTETRSIISTLDYGEGVPNVLIDDEGNIGVVIGTGSSNFVYQVYDIETLILQSESSFNLDKFLPPGPLQGAVNGNTLFYSNSLAQPSPVTFGPAYFNFENDTDFVIDILSIVQQVESETESTIVLTAMRYIEEAEVFLMGYANDNFTTEIIGGVLVISKTGTLLERIEVPFAPTYFIK
ncbi:hypothetical protein [uncultured Muriicola sp.]|uniref:hypothetical protein n=1 Tax=uncultured Muriicola sp. TaxID=1583102 RepID=UPI002617CAF2|nr:hypothetical protein [uncultured Muriicola sp.]